VPKAIEAAWKIESTWLIALLCHYTLECCMHVRSFCLLTFALPPLAALALPPAVHAASAVQGRGVRAAADCAAADCAAALRIALPNAHITAASALPSNDSLRGDRPPEVTEGVLEERIPFSRRVDGRAPWIEQHGDDGERACD